MSPTGIYLNDTSSLVIVSDQANNRLQIFDLDRTRSSPSNHRIKFLRITGSTGSNNLEFQGPTQLSQHFPTGNLLVADYLNDRVQMLTEQGDFIRSIGHKDMIRNPRAVSCSPVSHDILACDSFDKAHLFSSDGYALVRSFCSTGNSLDQTYGMTGVCFDDERKRIILCDNGNNRLSVWSCGGAKFLCWVSLPGKQQSSCVCVDKSVAGARIIVGTTQGQIYMFDARMVGCGEEELPEKAVIQTIGSQGNKPGRALVQWLWTNMACCSRVI